MADGALFRAGFWATVLATGLLSLGLFIGSHAGEAFDEAFFPILYIPAGLGALLLLPRPTRLLGLGIIVGVCTSLIVQMVGLFALFFAGGGS